MADTTTRKLIAEPEFDTLVTQFNALRRDSFTRPVHVDQNLPGAVTTPAAADLPTTQTLANALQVAFNAHAAAVDAHLAADTTNAPNATAAAVDLPTSQTLLNALKVAFNAHFAFGGQSLKQAIVQASAVVVTLNPPAADVITARVTAGTALAGPRVITDSGGTPTAPAGANALPGVATLSDDGTTLTFDAAVTNVTVEYVPRFPQSTIPHIDNDSQSAVATANAVDLPSSIALANALKAALNGHMAKAATSTKVVRGLP